MYKCHPEYDCALRQKNCLAQFWSTQSTKAFSPLSSFTISISAQASPWECVLYFVVLSLSSHTFFGISFGTFYKFARNGGWPVCTKPTGISVNFRLFRPSRVVCTLILHISPIRVSQKNLKVLPQLSQSTGSSFLASKTFACNTRFHPPGTTDRKWRQVQLRPWRRYLIE